MRVVIVVLVQFRTSRVGRENKENWRESSIAPAEFVVKLIAHREQSFKKYNYQLLKGLKDTVTTK